MDVIEHFTTLDQNQARRKLDYYADQYTNGTAEISDEVFDALVDLYEDKFHVIYDAIGAPPAAGVKDVPLPHPLFSLDKIKSGKKEDAKKLEEWLRSFPNDNDYIVADKVDGVSGLYTVQHHGSTVKCRLYTRGNGLKGTDITSLLEYLKLPIPKTDVAVRGEIILPDAAFEAYRTRARSIGTKNKLKSARNMTSGIVNASSVKDSDTFDPTVARDLQFLAYRVIETDQNQEQQYQQLEEWGFNVPWYQRVSSVGVDDLEYYLKLRRSDPEYKAEYLIDGLVIAYNQPYAHPLDGNPKHMFAFKFDTIAQVTVEKVKWNPQKDGKLTPIIYYEPIHLAGADCTKATGHNAKRIIDWGIGPGAVILITRSNEVIPYVVACLSPCERWDLPDLDVEEYSWNETEVDFVLTNPSDNDDVQVKKIVYFFDHMDIKQIGDERAKILYRHDLHSVRDIILASQQTFIDALGLVGEKVHDELHSKLRKASLAAVMTSSGIFGAGFGDRKMVAIVAAIPNILDLADQPTEIIAEKIRGIGGFDKMATVFAEKLPIFVEWLHGLNIRFERPSPPRSSKAAIFKGQKIVMSGKRHADITDFITLSGGKIMNSVSGLTDLVIVEDITKLTGKVMEAKSRGVEIISAAEFKRKYESQMRLE